jgi:hypothetical protein
MNEPQRLRDLGGPAASLLSAAELEVPSAARRRALAFTATAAAGVLSSGGALAASGSTLIKSVLTWILVGTVGGGLVSFGVAETIAHFESRPSAQRVSAPPLPLPPPAAEHARVAPAPSESAPLESPTPTAAAAPAATAPARPSSSVKAAKPTPAPATNLFEEQRSIEAARSAVTRGDAARALSTLDDYQRTYPQGQFGPEALALRVEALSLRGDREGARAFARQFEQRYPHHPLLSRVAASAAR